MLITNIILAAAPSPHWITIVMAIVGPIFCALVLAGIAARGSANKKKVEELEEKAKQTKESLIMWRQYQSRERMTPEGRARLKVFKEDWDDGTALRELLGALGVDDSGSDS